MNLRRFLIRTRWIKRLIKFGGILIASCIFLCEFLIPFIYISRCSWPNDNPNEFNLKVIALSDTHLFGMKRGNFFDKLKREFNMYFAFQISIKLFEPNSIFFLGDIFDEGLIADKKEFEKYSKRFFELFFTPSNVNLIVSIGNHDVGFHDRMVFFDPILRGRFEKVFNSSLIEFKTVNGINLVNVNSMAMNGDNCELCNYAKFEIEQISMKLFQKCKTKSNKLCEEERPILLSHFPLYRKSDLDCNEMDSNYNVKEKSLIISRKGCLSKESTSFLLRKLQPKLSLNGHTHYGCIKKHTIKLDEINSLSVDEYTLSSFNYRNRPNPGFILLLANSNESRISKCMLPNENYLFFIYSLPILYGFLRIIERIIERIRF